MRTYAQNGEDVIIDILLGGKKKGFYVDAGANMPDKDSVTKLFYLRGWRGINIEPIPHLYQELQKRRKRDINVNAGVADKAGKLTLREYNDGYHGWSTFSDNIKNLENHKVKNHKDYVVPVTTLKSILTKHKVKQIDFLKVDVEGFEYQALIGNDWDKWRPKVVVVENSSGKWPELLKELNYREVFFDGLNRYYVDDITTPELPLRDFKVLAEESSQRDVLAREGQIHAILTTPEDHIANKRLLRAFLKQIARKVVGSRASN